MERGVERTYIPDNQKNVWGLSKEAQSRWLDRTSHLGKRLRPHKQERKYHTRDDNVTAGADCESEAMLGEKLAKTYNQLERADKRYV